MIRESESNCRFDFGVNEIHVIEQMLRIVAKGPITRRELRRALRVDFEDIRPHALYDLIHRAKERGLLEVEDEALKNTKAGEHLLNFLAQTAAAEA